MGTQMFESHNIESALEAVLFVSGEAITVKKLSEIFQLEVDEIESALQGLQKRYEVAESGIQLRQIAGGWRLFSHPDYGDLIKKYVISMDTRKLSAAALETLSIIAYSQPVTRGGVASVRGVNSDSSINSLLEKGLIREAGCSDDPGNPVLYATTSMFLEHFGLNSLRDLPDINDFAPDEKTRNLIMDRLSATKITSGQMEMFEDEKFDRESSGKGGAEATEDSARSDSPKKESSNADKPEETDPQSLFATALSSALGTTEKVDVENLVLETDDE